MNIDIDQASTISEKAAASASTDEALQCPVCRRAEGNVERFLRIASMPVLCNVLYETQDEALGVARGDLDLGFCTHCGHVYNYAFDPALIAYTQTYENSLHFSPRFQAYATSLADRLIERYDLRGKAVVEIGCGKGDFLQLLCERGGNEGVGFDPSYEPEEGSPQRFTVVRDFYSAQYAHHDADIIVCRHVLEHIEAPVPFLQMVRDSVGDQADTVVFFEVPNALFTLREMAIWDLIYEHCSYFTPQSLRRLFEASGFDVLRVDETFGGQYLTIEAAPSPSAPANNREHGVPNDLIAQVRQFAERFEAKTKEWRGLFDRVGREGQRAVVWGAGSKGVTILNMLQVRDAITHVVDINPRKEGRFIAGTGQQVVAPSFLESYRPDLVIIMNPIYASEIRGEVAEMGLQPAFAIAS